MYPIPRAGTAFKIYYNLQGNIPMTIKENGLFFQSPCRFTPVCTSEFMTLPLCKKSLRS